MQIMSKAISAVAAAALVAGAIALLTSASGSVSANAPLNGGKTDRLDIGTRIAANCAAQTWPNFDAACLKDRRQPMSAARAVRVITEADHIADTSDGKLAMAKAGPKDAALAKAATKKASGHKTR